jgi:hypothetical protein
MDQDIYATYSRRSISDGSGLDPDSMLDQIATEIENMAAAGNVAASNQVEILDSLDSDAERKLQMEQMYVYQLPTYMHNNGIFGGIDQVRARGTSFHSTAQPSGAAGPHAGDQDWQLWVKGYGAFGNRDAGNTYNDGYDVQAYGTVIGTDKAFGKLLIGLAGGFSGSNLDGENGDTSEATTPFGLIYASAGTNEWFGDIVASYGVSDIENKSGTAFDVTSSTKAAQSALYIGGGKQFTEEESSSLLRPSLGLQISHFDQDAYTEQSENAVAKDVEAYDRLSYQSILGGAMLIPKAGKKVDWENEFRVYWLHDFNGDEDSLNYTLVDSQQPGQFIFRSPDQDVGQLGYSLLAKWKNGFQLRGGIDGQISKSFYSTTFSGSILYEF